MERKFYRISQFANKGSLSKRALRYYDQVGLLRPSHYSESGYRLYTDEDFPRLQQILALKYLGFSLDEIRACLENGPAYFKDALALQKEMLHERKAHLETILQTIEQTEARLDGDPQDWEAITDIIEVLQMDEDQEWIKKYFNEEQIKKVNEVSQSTYSDEAAKKLAEWGQGWSEQDQREADGKWNELYTEAQRLADTGSDPAGPQAQALAARWMGLVAEFTQGDPQVEAGLREFWQQMGELPEQDAPLPKRLDAKQQAFVDEALAVYQQRQGGV